MRYSEPNTIVITVTPLVKANIRHEWVTAHITASTAPTMQTVIASLGGTEGLPAIGAASNRSARARKASGDVREGTVAAAILKALDEAGPAGLSGRAVNDAVEVAGFGIHSSEKVKAQLKREMRVRHDADKRWWYALNVDATAPDSTED